MPALSYGFAAFAMLFQIAIYAGIAYVIWKFYQLLTKISEDIAAIKIAMRGQASPAGQTPPAGKPVLPGQPESELDISLDPEYQLPPDHPLARR